MPFEWLHPHSGKRPSRTAEVYRQELQERAALLYRLRYPKARARARLVANVRWDYEVGRHKAPVAESEVSALVDAVYARHGASQGPLTI